MEMTSDKFEIRQGVKQGGLLSADLYKVYSEDMLHILDKSDAGGRIGDIRLNATACADDVVVLSNKASGLQTLIHHSKHYSKLHKYIIQPQKSVVIEPEQKNKKGQQYEWKMDDKIMPIVEKSTHLGICRGSTIKKTEKETIQQNISKARRAAYSLMPIGLHGENGLDPETLLHLIQIYIQPILTYGLEIILPGRSGIQTLELCQKKLIKRILSVPKNTPDPAIYVLSGFIPVEGQVDMKVLTFFNNICRQDISSLEKRIAYRQLLVKDASSSRWLIALRKILHRYDLPGALQMLDNPICKHKWKKQIREAVYSYWKQRIITDCSMYKSLKFLNTDAYQPGSVHNILKILKDPTREMTRLAVKLKLVTGTYILQTKRHSFGSNYAHSAICLLCEESDETVEHFILSCKILNPIRDSVINSIDTICVQNYNSSFLRYPINIQLQFILDASKAHEEMYKGHKTGHLQELEYESRRLCYLLHGARQRILIGMDTKRTKMRRK